VADRNVSAAARVLNGEGVGEARAFVDALTPAARVELAALILQRELLDDGSARVALTAVLMFCAREEDKRRVYRAMLREAERFAETCCVYTCDSFDGRDCALPAGHEGRHRCAPSLARTDGESRSVSTPSSTGSERATAESAVESQDTHA
jgi:hypothetical protein